MRFHAGRIRGQLGQQLDGRDQHQPGVAGGQQERDRLRVLAAEGPHERQQVGQVGIVRVEHDGYTIGGRRDHAGEIGARRHGIVGAGRYRAAMYEDGPQWLYRIYDGPKGKRLLYVGVTSSLPRRMSQHLRDKEWFPADGRITFEMYDDRASVLAAEEAAITKERPLYNVQHNIRVEVSIRAEVELTGNALFAMLAMGLGVALLLKWGSDVYAVRRERELAERQGIEHESPNVACPFTENPPGTAAKLFWTMLALAASPPPPPIVPGDAESYAVFDSWQKSMAPVAAIWAKASAN